MTAQHWHYTAGLRLHLSAIVCRQRSLMCKHATIIHFSQIRFWNKECKDVLQSLSWHYALFIPFSILSLLLKAPLFLCVHTELPGFTITHTAHKTWHIKKPIPIKRFQSRNEIQFHHQMSGWARKTSVSHSSKNWKAGQSRWNSSERVTETAYSMHKY